MKKLVEYSEKTFVCNRYVTDNLSQRVGQERPTKVMNTSMNR